MERPTQKLRARRRPSGYVTTRMFVGLLIILVALAFFVTLIFQGNDEYNDLPRVNLDIGNNRMSVGSNTSFEPKDALHTSTRAKAQAPLDIFTTLRLSSIKYNSGSNKEVVVHENPGTVHEAPYTTSGHDGGPFITRLRKLSYCHYEVKNFCVINGLLTFFHRGDSSPRRSGLRVCNEFSRHSPSIYIKYLSLPQFSGNSSNLPAPLNTIKKGWILQFWCQDLFHMTLTLLPAFQTRTDIDQDDPDVYVRIARGHRRKGGYCNVKLGDPRDFENPHNSKYAHDKQFPFAGNPYWPFYRILTTHPEKIHPLVPGQSVQTACYQHGVIDKRYIKSMTGAEARAYSAALLRSLNVTAGRAGPCGAPYRVTLIDRRGRTRRLSNVPALLEAARGLGMAARAVAFETLPIREQLRVVTETDLLLGVHGNGLTWLQFLPPGSAVIELVGVWYTPYALLWGHSYFHSSKRKNKEFEANGPTVPFAQNLTEVQELLLAAKKALDGTRCAKTPYEPPNRPLSELYASCVPHC